jgi:hypothetical protein
MSADGREWLAALGLRQTAREQLSVALAMIDVLDVQLARERRARAEPAPVKP